MINKKGNEAILSISARSSGRAPQTPNEFTGSRSFAPSARIASDGAEVVGPLRMTLRLGAPMVNKFQDPDTMTLTMGFLRISLPWLKKILNFNARE